MIKQIKKFGNSLGITLDKEDLRFFGLQEGDWLDVGLVKTFPPKSDSKDQELKEI